MLEAINNLDRSPESDQLTREPGGWTACRLPQPHIEPDAARLLAESAESRPGNVRFAIADGQVYRLAELRNADGLLAWPEAQARLLAPALDVTHEVCPLELDCLLGETVHEWSQSEDEPDTWQTVASDPRGDRFPLTATVVSGGVEVRSPLGDGELRLGTTSQAALARYLIAVHDRLRFARFVLSEGQVSAVSLAAADRLEFELPDSVSAVLAACRLVCREVRALADEAVAKAYLEASL